MLITALRLRFVGPFQAQNICKVRPRPGTRCGRADPWHTQTACKAVHLLLVGVFSSTQQVALRTQAKPSTPKVNEEELHVALMTDKLAADASWSTIIMMQTIQYKRLEVVQQPAWYKSCRRRSCCMPFWQQARTSNMMLLLLPSSWLVTKAFLKVHSSKCSLLCRNRVRLRCV